MHQEKKPMPDVIIKQVDAGDNTPGDTVISVDESTQPNSEGDVIISTAESQGSERLRGHVRANDEATAKRETESKAVKMKAAKDRETDAATGVGDTGLDARIAREDAERREMIGALDQGMGAFKPDVAREGRQSHDDAIVHPPLPAPSRGPDAMPQAPTLPSAPEFTPGPIPGPSPEPKPPPEPRLPKNSGKK